MKKNSEIKRVMKKDDLARALAAETGFYIKNCVEMVTALEEIILENMKMAEFDNPSEIRLAPGVIIGGKRKAEGPAKNPQTGETTISPEKVIPYSKFGQVIRYKLYTDKRGYEKIRVGKSKKDKSK